jgi:peptidoglycan hydrolase-like protein with peptidoglycan-binding domain
MIKLGDKGLNVVELQNALNNKVIWGSTPKLVPDGQFGNATFNALKMFQTQNKLPVTGVADSTTLNKLGVKTTQLLKKDSILSNLSTIHYISGGVLVLGVLAFISYKIRK